MASESRHISIGIGRPAGVVYEFAVDPRHLPEWAAGIGTSIELVDDEWVAESPMGRITVRFADHNDLGVLDHVVTLPTGERFDNPMRVIPDGQGSEVIFTLRRWTGESDLEFESDAAAIAADLATLKRLLEAGAR
jgi:hypothetical protein